MKQTIQELFERREYLVPFIGDDLFYVEFSETNRQPLQSYIVDSFVKDNPDVVVDHDEIIRMKNSGYYGLTLLNRRFKSRYIYRYKEYVKSVYPLIKLNQVVKRFLKAGNFPLIVTTSPFGFLEKELHGDDYDSLYYSIDNPLVNQVIEKKKRNIFHLFGEAERYKSKWVYNEKELLVFLHSLHDSMTAPKGLTTYLADKSMLLLGCNLPNWLFQFLWFPINIERDPIFPTGEDTTEGYWLGKSESNMPLDDFLEDIGFRFSSVDEMENVITQVSDKYENSITDGNDGYDIFISYAGVNGNLARKIKVFLESKGLNVWIDKDGGDGQIEIGGDYWKHIREGIRHSRYFMPVVTAEYLNKWLLNTTAISGTKEPGLITETNIAIEWQKNVDNPYKDAEVYSLPVIVENGPEPELIESLSEKGILPQEIFGSKQYYYYSSADDCTFKSHPWERYKRDL